MLVYHSSDVYQHGMFMFMFISARNKSKNSLKYSMVQKLGISTM